MVKTGSVSVKRPSVTSSPCPSGEPGQPDPAQRAGSGLRPGRARPSPATKASPVTAPSAGRGQLAHLAGGDVHDQQRGRRARRRRRSSPSGAAARSATRPSWPAASRRGAAAGQAGRTRRARSPARRSPSASVTQTTWPSRPSTRGQPGRDAGRDRRARGPGRRGGSASARCRGPPPRWPGRCGRRTAIAQVVLGGDQPGAARRGRAAELDVEPAAASPDQVVQQPDVAPRSGRRRARRRCVALRA